MASSIGNFNFVRMTIPEFQSHSVDLSTQSGTNEWSAYLTGRRGRVFTLETWADMSPRDDAFTTFQFGYLPSIGQELLLSWEPDMSSHNQMVLILDVTLRRSPSTMVASVGGLAGGFVTDGSFLECSWTVLGRAELIQP